MAETTEQGLRAIVAEYGLHRLDTGCWGKRPDGGHEFIATAWFEKCEGNTHGCHAGYGHTVDEAVEKVLAHVVSCRAQVAA